MDDNDARDQHVEAELDELRARLFRMEISKDAFDRRKASLLALDVQPQGPAEVAPEASPWDAEPVYGTTAPNAPAPPTGTDGAPPAPARDAGDDYTPPFVLTFVLPMIALFGLGGLGVPFVPRLVVAAALPAVFIYFDRQR